ncbi:MAG TPA: cytochrome o ubiquinol oxidase subunit IV [Patescibacteria group bacterium]|nr:cytochrome o ubiquinol oxidase subunit IV [Patescibacteria group bacterium]
MTTAHASENSHGNLSTYLTGFSISIALTLLAFFLVVNKVGSGNALMLGLLVLAIIQLFVQMVFFLHLGRESKPKWNLAAFAFMMMVLLILVIGSLWIMNHLNYHQMSPAETDNSILHDENLRPQAY